MNAIESPTPSMASHNTSARYQTPSSNEPYVHASYVSRHRTLGSVSCCLVSLLFMDRTVVDQCNNHGGGVTMDQLSVIVEEWEAHGVQSARGKHGNDRQRIDQKRKVGVFFFYAEIVQRGLEKGRMEYFHSTAHNIVNWRVCHDLVLSSVIVVGRSSPVC